MSYYLRKDNNSESSTYNRWYAFVDRAGLISTRGLAEYLVNIGVKLDRSELESIIVRLAQAIPEIVAQGYSVKVEGLGVFSAFIANQKGGAPDPSKFNIQEHVKGVRFRFRPDSSDLDNLTSKTFGKHVSLGNGSYVLEKGNKAPKYPLAAYKPQP
jgi:hypothetical protein